MTIASSLRLECADGNVIDVDAIAAKTGDLVFDVGIIPTDAHMTTYCVN